MKNTGVILTSIFTAAVMAVSGLVAVDGVKAVRNVDTEPAPKQDIIIPLSSAAELPPVSTADFPPQPGSMVFVDEDALPSVTNTDFQTPSTYSSWDNVARVHDATVFKVRNYLRAQGFTPKEMTSVIQLPTHNAAVYRHDVTAPNGKQAAAEVFCSLSKPCYLDRYFYYPENDSGNSSKPSASEISLIREKGYQIVALYDTGNIFETSFILRPVDGGAAVLGKVRTNLDGTPATLTIDQGQQATPEQVVVGNTSSDSGIRSLEASVEAAEKQRRTAGAYLESQGFRTFMPLSINVPSWRELDARKVDANAQKMNEEQRSDYYRADNYSYAVKDKQGKMLEVSLSCSVNACFNLQSAGSEMVQKKIAAITQLQDNAQKKLNENGYDVVSLKWMEPQNADPSITYIVQPKNGQTKMFGSVVYDKNAAYKLTVVAKP